MQATKISRNELGLIEGFEYKFTPDGLIDWRAMVPNEFLYPNPQERQRIEKKYKKKIEEINIVDDKIADSDLVINLKGIKYLLRLRGYTKVDYTIREASTTYAGVKCDILFKPNYETENCGIHFSDCGSAHHGSTKGFGQNYLVEIATNRSFCRAVRNFLNINIVSGDELGKEEEKPGENTSISNDQLLPRLQQLMTKYGITFDQITSKIPDIDKQKWNKIDDLPSKWVVWCIERIIARNEKKDKKIED